MREREKELAAAEQAALAPDKVQSIETELRNHKVCHLLAFDPVRGPWLGCVSAMLVRWMWQMWVAVRLTVPNSAEMLLAIARGDSTSVLFALLCAGPDPRLLPAAARAGEVLQGAARAAAPAHRKTQVRWPCCASPRLSIGMRCCSRARWCC